ncbi:MAG: CBS domain-containing protein, partial [Pseudomonadota bacterium]
LPLMITCIISSLASRRLLPDSIYTLKLARRGVNIREGKEVNVLKSISVRDVMNREVETVQENMNLDGLGKKISRSKHNSFPVVNDRNELTGIVSYFDYRDVIFDEALKDLVVAKDIATSKVVTLTLSDNLYTAFEKITSKDFSILPIVSPEDPKKLEGVLTRRDIIGAYNKAVIKKDVLKG